MSNPERVSVPLKAPEGMFNDRRHDKRGEPSKEEEKKTTIIRRACWAEIVFDIFYDWLKMLESEKGEDDDEF